MSLTERERERLNEAIQECYYDHEMTRHFEAVVAEMLAEAWQAGAKAAVGNRYMPPNPYRKLSDEHVSGDAPSSPSK